MPPRRKCCLGGIVLVLLGVWLPLRLIGAIDDIVAVTVNGESVSQSVVDRPLPPLGKGVDGPLQPLACQGGAIEVEDADLLVRNTLKLACAMTIDKPSEVGRQHPLDAKLLAIEGGERDVAQRVVLPFACTSDVADPRMLRAWASVVFKEEAGGLRQVVVVLLCDVVDDVLVSVLKLLG